MCLYELIKRFEKTLRRKLKNNIRKEPGRLFLRMKSLHVGEEIDNRAVVLMEIVERVTLWPFTETYLYQN